MTSWVGFYVYERRDEMVFESVEINNNTGNFRAVGSDVCGAFVFNGSIQGGRFEAIKDYNAWVIYYSGDYDAEKLEITGHWGYELGQRLSPFVIAKIPNHKIADFKRDLLEGRDPFSR